MFGLNWGNGFITNQDIINSRGLSDPNAFFQDLLTKPYSNNVSCFASIHTLMMYCGDCCCSFTT